MALLETGMTSCYMTAGTYLTFNSYVLSENTHVVVYAAKFSHASYPWSGIQKRFVSHVNSTALTCKHRKIYNVRDEVIVLPLMILQILLWISGRRNL